MVIVKSVYKSIYILLVLRCYIFHQRLRVCMDKHEHTLAPHVANRKLQSILRYLDIVGTVHHLAIYIYVVQQDTQCGLNE